MNGKTICSRVLLSLMAIAAAVAMAPSPAQSVTPPITKDIVDAAGDKRGSITFATLTTTPGGIADFDLEGFTEAGLLDGSDWQIDPVTGEVSSLVLGFLQGDPPIVALGVIIPAGDDSCAGSILLFGSEGPVGRSFQVRSYACTGPDGERADCEFTGGPAIPVALVDPDGDGVLDDDDNGPLAANADQAAGDGAGDACDGDLDGDGCSTWPTPACRAKPARWSTPPAARSRTCARAMAIGRTTART